MGPERKAPENFIDSPDPLDRYTSFNGAGAKGSGKQITCAGILPNLRSFNGAGAKGSGKPGKLDP